MTRKRKNGNGNGNGNGKNDENSIKINNINNNDKIRLKKNIVIITAKNQSQKLALKTIKEKDISVITGIAGSGKSFLAASYALQELSREKYKKIIISRPCKEAHGEHLGFLPGDFNEKIYPYMIPVFDCFLKYIDKKQIDFLISEGIIVTLPLAFTRGVTFEDAIVIGDEFQNTIPEQVRMFLTRKGANSKIIITGDIHQSDIDGKNGLVDMIERLKDIDKIGFVDLEEPVRDIIIKEIEEKYQKNEK